MDSLVARLPRIILPGVPLHIYQRGNNRGCCFRCDIDRKFYLSRLKRYSVEYKVAIHSYVLMTNHIHLLVTPESKAATASMMKALGVSYVRYFNNKYERTGTLWEGRFKASLVDSDNYFLTVSCYIEMNPVRAKMVRQPSQYKWSSFNVNGLGASTTLLKQHQVYVGLGDCQQTRLERYRALFPKGTVDEGVEAVRNALAKGAILGDEAFKSTVESQLELVRSRYSKGGDRRSKVFRAAQKPIDFKQV